MSGKPRTPAYYAVSRALDDHRLFVNEKHPLSRKEAFLWLIKAAAWKPQGRRVSHGFAEVVRGQVAITIRGLAFAWRWPRWRVEYFLKLLREDGTIETAVIPTKIPTKIQTRNSYRATVITLCKYDTYQGALKGAGAAAASVFRQDDRTLAPQLPGIVNDLGTEPQKPLEPIRILEEATNGGLRSVNYVDKYRHGRKWKTKPPHGIRSKKHGKQWWDYGTSEWQEAAEFDRVERGIETFPESYPDGGRGNWFKERSREEWQDWGRRLSANGRR